MNNNKKQQMSKLLARVFRREISNSDLFETAANVLDVQNGEAYPKFVWKADHYITDEDLCRKDAEYETTMRKDILALFEDYFSSEDDCQTLR